MAALAALPAPVAAQEASLAERFGSRGTILDISLSPSGQQIAFIMPGGPLEEMVYLIDLRPGGVQRPIAVDSNPNGFLTNCDWANEQYLLCNFRGTSKFGDMFIGYSRLLVVSADGSGVREMGDGRDSRTYGPAQYGGGILSLDIEGKDNAILVQQVTGTRWGGTRVYSGDSGATVNEIDLETLRSTQVMRPREVSAGYLTDENGDIRVMATRARRADGYMRDDDLEFSYMPVGSSNWRTLAPQRDLNELDIIGVDTGREIAYALGEEDGYRALYSIRLDGSGQTTRLLAQEGYDIDNVVTIGRQRRVVGATFATDRRQFEYFDEDLRQLSQDLTQALPGSPLVEIIDASEDERRLLVLAHSDVDPGVIYLLDRNTNQMDEILPLRRELEGLPLSSVRSVRFAARDGVEIPGYLTLPPGSDGKGLPAIVMPHGGPSSRDVWGFDWLAQYFAQQGYAVLQPNYRGSTGYGSAWEMENGFQSWRTAMGDVADAARWMVSEGIANSDQLAVVGWSYGGYAALQLGTTEPDLFAAIVAIAPVTDLGVLRDDARDFVNYPAVSDFLGGGSLIQEASPARNADRIQAPVLLVHAEYDENVPYRHSEIMQDALEDAGKSVTFVSFPDLDHSIRDSGARARMLAAAGSFLEENLGAGGTR
ncbi:S9 family peptidase [Alteraurantiacibacter aestuarii]|uniref:alpha/beta hydrolase family protein n=1 Tax=Alteraurantiacibacter aestuarii TaxID=650004 RepID=UPI0031CE496D